ncbi:hypothetical protein RGUI_0250 [Rhodovulum sp. P5]|nr:hypothetical protein RGUI_0250 [Rhodovulum sp. P5]
MALVGQMKRGGPATEAVAPENCNFHRHLLSDSWVWRIRSRRWRVG